MRYRKRKKRPSSGSWSLRPLTSCAAGCSCGTGSLQGLSTRPASVRGARRGHFLFLDLGTNGEVVLKAGEELIATSTAAGPAFEGMNISCGMPALAGAVYKREDRWP